MRDQRRAFRDLFVFGGAVAWLPGTCLSASADTIEPADALAAGSRVSSAAAQQARAAPLTVLTRDDIERSGALTLGALLQQQPWSGPARDAQTNFGGDGTTRFSGWGLGPQRMVVLVDGRRWIGIADGSGAVDLDGLPLAMIERIEVLREDASAAYGADAVAGAINVVTRRPEGLATRAAFGRFDQGDGARLAAEAAWGARGARGGVSVTLAHLEHGPVFARDRRATDEPVWLPAGGPFAGDVFYSNYTPMGRFRVPDADDELGAGYAVFDGHATRDVGSDATPSAADFRAFVSPDDRYNTQDQAYLDAEGARTALRAEAHHGFGDGTTLTAAAFHEQRDSAQQLAPYALGLGSAVSGLRWNGVAIGIDDTNPYNFFGLPLVPSASGSVVGDGQLNLNTLQRRLVEVGPRRDEQSGTTLDLALELDGAWGVFDWTTGVHRGESTLDAAHAAQVSPERLALALGPVADCTAPCVPLNLLGGAGSITPAMADYIAATGHDRATLVVEGAHATLRRGEFEALAAGPGRFALGVEARRESIDADADPAVAAGEITGTERHGVHGALAQRALFVELGLPLLGAGGGFGALDLELAAAATATEHDRFETAPGTRLALSWAPTDALTLRAAWLRGERAPTLRELFQDATPMFPVVIDACTGPSPVIITGAEYGVDYTPDSQAEAQLLANCTGQAVTGAFNATPSPAIPASAQVPWGYAQMDVQLAADDGGNPDLRPETAASRSFGLGYRPGFVEGLTLTLDARALTLDGAVRDDVSVSRLMTGCYEHEITTLCEQIQRDVTGAVTELFIGPLNLGRIELETWDLALDQRFETTAALPGAWRVRWETAYIESWRRCDPMAGCEEQVQGDGLDGALPKFRSLLTVSWTRGAWQADWRTRFIGRHYEACSSSAIYYGGPCSNPVSSWEGTNALGAVAYHAVQVSYTLPEWDTRLSIGIENLGDKRPPLSTRNTYASYDTTAYATPGRFIQLGVSKGF